MAIKFNFGGKTVIEPGSYARIVGGSSQVPPAASFGKVMLIDTGSNEGYGIGAGINGELASGKGNIFEFADVTEFKDFMRGGLFWDLADYLFRPTLNGQGVESIKYVRAGTTTAAKSTITLTGSAFATKVGTITSTIATTTVVGVGTSFLEDVKVGDSIADDATDTPIGIVASITDDLNLELVANATAALTAEAYSTQATQPQGGSLVVATRNEGIGANGIQLDSNLVKGFGYKMEAGVLDPTKFRIVFYEGSFRGINSASPTFSLTPWDVSTAFSIDDIVHYNGLAWKAIAGSTGSIPDANPSDWEIYEYTDNYGSNLPSQSVQQPIVSTPEVSTVNELVYWMENDSTFKTYFALTSSTVTGDGIIDDGDLAAYATLKNFIGGTVNYSPSDFDDVLDNITEEDNSFFLSDQWGKDAKSVQNTKLLSHLSTDAEFEKLVVMGGGLDKGEFKGTDGSIGIAEFFNSSKAMLVHGGINVPKFGGGEKQLASVYHAALYLGRTAGLEPQVPTTWKDLQMSSPIHELSKKERELALMAGVIHLRFVDGKGWVCNQSINTLQRNEVLFLPNGDSYEVSLERIKLQLNKELIINSRVIFVGGNLNTASAEDVKLFTEGQLIARTARPNLDNLIISFRDVKVSLSGDAWKISYGYVPNSPINKLFFTGVQLDANISI